MKYKHLFFDLDHTLWDFETNSKDSLKDLHQQFQLAEKGVLDFELFFERYSFHNERLWDRYTKGFIKQEELRWKRMWLSLLDFKIGDESLAKNMAIEFLNILPTKKHLFPYTIELLEYLLQKNYTLHLITNGFEQVQHNKLANAGIKKYFKEVITSEASNSLKPKKEIFDFALLKANANIKESIMIGDNIDADILGALNAGMDAMFVNHINTPTTIQPTYTVYDLREITTIL